MYIWKIPSKKTIKLFMIQTKLFSKRYLFTELVKVESSKLKIAEQFLKP
jgi:hypothetical protein